MIADLAKMGVGLVQTAEISGGASTAFLDTEKKGGLFFELITRSAG